MASGAKASGRDPLYLDEAAVAACLSGPEVLDVVSQTLRNLHTGDAITGPKAGFGIPGDGDDRHMGVVMGCVLSQNAAGAKWFTTSDRNSARGLPRLPATLVVCDATTGMLEGVVDATGLTAPRTAAMAVASSLMAAGDTVLDAAAVVGGGRIGSAVAAYLSASGRVRQVVVVDPTYAMRADERSNDPIRCTSNIEQAIRGADLIVTATNVSSDCSLVEATWVMPGAVVCTIGSYREIDPEIIHSAGDILVDDLQGVQLRGNLASEFRSGRLVAAQITGDLSSLMAGGWQRRSPDRAVLLACVGIGVLDVALGAEALANARSRGLGIRLAPTQA